MKIKDIISSKNLTLSFEIFPPKKSDNEETYQNIKKAATEISKIGPDFMSVTCGAGGGTSKQTLPMVQYLESNCHVTAIEHLTCVSSTKEDVHNQLVEMKKLGIDNILALRGDIPKDFPPCEDYLHANELIQDIKLFGDFCVGGACYPEKHIESKSAEEDIHYLKIKADAGCDFLTTQMFFDNNAFYSFLDKIRNKGVFLPILPGIMPVTNAKSIKRSCELSGASIPKSLQKILEKYGDSPEEMYKAGIEFASNQIIDLISHGMKNIHLYTMNKPSVANKIKENFLKIGE